MAFYKTFYSVRELGEYVENTDSNGSRPRKSQGQSAFFAANSECSNFTFHDAIECALNGGSWQEGAENMPDTGDIVRESMGVYEQQCLNALPVGFMPIVPNVLANTPDAMMGIEQQIKPARVLKIAVHVGRNYNIQDYETYNRGAAILGAIDQLERSGVSCELWAIWRNTSGKSSVDVRTLIKASGEHWQADKAAFAFCSLAFQRRLCWRVAETASTRDYMITSKKNMYGSEWQPDDEFYNDFDVYIPRMNSEGQFMTLRQSIERIKKYIDKEAG